MSIKTLATACLIGTIAIANPLKAESLLEIYQLALDNDPKYQSSGALLEASIQQNGQSTASLLPRITANYSNNYSKSGSSLAQFSTFGGSTTTNETRSNSLGVSLNQTIYDYSTWVSYDQSNKRIEQAKVRFKSQQQELIVRVSQAYLDVLGAKDDLSFAKKEQEAIQQQLEQTKQRYEVGLIAITDVHEAQARFDQSEADRIRSQNALDNAYEALREITGRYTENLYSLNTDIPLVSPEPAQIDDWVQVAKESNLNIIAANMDVYISRQDVKRRFGGHYPSVSLSANYSDSTSSPDQIPVDVESYSLSGGINVSIPLYSGGLTNSQVKEGRALHKKASYDLESALRGAVRTTRSSYLGVEASISGIKALQQSVISQESALEATQAGFEVGTRTIVDVLLSTRSLYSARSSLSKARYDYIMATLRLKQAAGTLTQDDLININKWMNPTKQ